MICGRRTYLSLVLRHFGSVLGSEEGLCILQVF